MGRSLFFKLLGGFVLVITAGAAVMTVLANQAVANAFRNYTDRNSQVWANSLAPALANYYSQNQTWVGVNSLLQDPLAWTSPETPEANAGTLSTGFSPQGLVTLTPVPPTSVPLDIYPTSSAQPETVESAPEEPTGNGMMGGGGMGHGMMGTGRGMMGMGMTSNQTPTPVYSLSQPTGVAGAAPGSVPSMTKGMHHGMRSWQGTGTSGGMNVWSMMGHRVIVADAAGQVVSDSSGEKIGATLSVDQLSGGETIQVSGQPAGTILVETSSSLPGTPASEFLRAMNRSILVSALAAGFAAMVLGGALFFQITAPVRKLKAAAAAIAAGDLSQRVKVGTRDELGDLASAFNQMAESLSQAEAQRRQMVADVAHELRTPLTVMQANLEAMQDGVFPLDAEQIGSLHEETVLLGRLVADLHLLSVAEAGQLKLERQEVEAGELVRKAAERLLTSAQERGVTLEIETPAALPFVMADADRVSQVIGNLISNSLRYTGEGGTITVKVEQPSVPTASRNVNGRQSEVLISVTDTGTGIPAETLLKIFDRFYRADKSRTRTGGGSGLGLAIVKHIVEAHGGRAWAESPVWNADQQKGPGARFWFTLPISA